MRVFQSSSPRPWLSTDTGRMSDYSTDLYPLFPLKVNSCLPRCWWRLPGTKASAMFDLTLRFMFPPRRWRMESFRWRHWDDPAKDLRLRHSPTREHASAGQGWTSSRLKRGEA